jgi:hypothetical protein
MKAFVQQQGRSGEAAINVQKLAEITSIHRQTDRVRGTRMKSQPGVKHKFWTSYFIRRFYAGDRGSARRFLVAVKTFSVTGATPILHREACHI